MRLIDADAIDDVVMRLNAEGDSGITRSEYKLIDSVLFEFPTVDAEPVRHGEWEPYEFGDDTWHKCSVCGTADKYINIVVRKGFADVRLVSKRNYCPICGAKMDLQ